MVRLERKIAFKHDFADGTVVDARFQMTWVAPHIFRVSVAGASLGYGYLLDGYCHYHLETGQVVSKRATASLATRSTYWDRARRTPRAITLPGRKSCGARHEPLIHRRRNTRQTMNPSSDHRPDVPRAEAADAVVRHILPEAVAIDDGLLEQDPGVEEREPDGEAHDARRRGGLRVLCGHARRLLVQVDLRSRVGRALLTIGQVASRTGLRVSAIRYYESRGLLPKVSRIGGRRVYEGLVLERLAIISWRRRPAFISTRFARPCCALVKESLRFVGRPSPRRSSMRSMPS